MSDFTGSQRQLSELRARLSTAAHAEIQPPFHTLSFQPGEALGERSEDRHYVRELSLPDGTWKMIGVFDGAS